MALTDKNILITPNIGAASDPKIVFSGADAATAAQNITLTVYPTNGGTLSFDGSTGQLFSVTNSMSGTIFSANDVSGIPSIEVIDTGLVKIAQYSGNVLLGSGTDSGLAKLQVAGAISATTGTFSSNMSVKQAGDASAYALKVVGGTGSDGTYAGIYFVNEAQDTSWGFLSANASYISVNNHFRISNKDLTLSGGNISVTGTINATGAITQASNQVLHAGNYTSYSPSLTGGSASGTWGINITGNAAALSTTSTISSTRNDAGVLLQSYNSSASNAAQFNIAHVGANVTMSNARGTLTLNGNVSGSSGSTTGNAISASTVAIFSTGGTTFYLVGSQTNVAGNVNLYYGLPYYNSATGRLNVPAGIVLDAGNYNLYSPSLTGGSASGTWGISITGNAVTASHSFGRTDSATYPVLWGVAGGTTQMYSCTAVNIQSSTGTLNATTIYATGNVTAYSDERVKTNWRELSSVFIKDLAKVKSGIYDRTDCELTQVGVSAQSLQNVLPNAVIEDEEGKLSVVYGHAALVSAVELAKEVVSLNARIARLEALVSKLIEG